MRLELLELYYDRLKDGHFSFKENDIYLALMDELFTFTPDIEEDCLEHMLDKNPKLQEFINEFNLEIEL